MNIYTSYYGNKKNIDTDKYCYVSISVSTPKWDLPYELEHCKILKPYSIFGKYDNMKDYTREYRKYLDSKGVVAIQNVLEYISKKNGNKDLVLLCYEKNKFECHRNTFADWWYEKTGQKVREINEPVGLFD